MLLYITYKPFEEILEMLKRFRVLFIGGDSCAHTASIEQLGGQDLPATIGAVINVEMIS